MILKGDIKLSELGNRKKPRRMQQYRLRMTDKEADRLKRLSKETGMSCADVLRDALEKYKGIGNGS
jgi:hypothetical protein